MPSETTNEGTSALFDFTGAAAYLNVTESWLRRAATAGKVPHRRIGHRIRFAESDLLQIIADSAVTPTTTTRDSLRPSRRRSK